MPPARPHPPPPRQARSRRTLERILVAAETLLEKRLFEDVGMAEIAERAGVSVGTIYTRFPGKEALLPVLFARHDAAVAGRVARLLRELERLPALERRVERLVAFAVDYHRRRRGLLRALTMYVRSNPRSVPARTFRERRGQYRAVAEAVVGGEGIHGDAVSFALGVVNSVCREQILFDEVSPMRRGGTGHAALERDLVELVRCYLASAERESDSGPRARPSKDRRGPRCN